MEKLNGADYLLLLLFLNDKKPIDGAIRLEKMMFLFDKEIVPIMKNEGIALDNLPEFIPYDFGPFSKDVYEQVELFKGIKFIQVTNIYAKEEMVEADDLEELPFLNEIENKGYELKTDGVFYRYTLLKLGEKYVIDNILPLVNKNNISLLEKFKEKITSLPAKHILKYVYLKYPEYTSKSLIKDKVLNDE